MRIASLVGSILFGGTALEHEHHAEHDEKRETAEQGEPEPGKNRWRWTKRPAVWIGSLATAVVTAVAVSLAVFFANHALGVGGPSSGSVHPTSGQSQAWHSAAPRPASPVIVESVTQGFFQDYSFVTRQKTPASQEQLQSVDRHRLSYNWAPPPPTAIANVEAITLTLAGNSSAPITINNLMIVRHCTTPLTGGTLFYSPTGGGGPVLVPNIDFNLDGPVAIGQYGRYLGSRFPPGGNFFIKKAIVLKYHEPQTLEIFVSTLRYYCTFTFNLNIATVSGQVSQPITYHGQPFVITADGEVRPNGRVGRVQFRHFDVVYAGGMADRQNDYKFIRVNPAAYHGTGDPALFPVSS